MNELEQFYKDLDTCDWDNWSEESINLRLQKVNDALSQKGLGNIAYFSELERLCFALRKSFNWNEEKKGPEGVIGQMSRQDLSETGEKVKFEWPDINTFSKDDFDYIEKRFLEVRNLYAKTEYGLILYFRQPTPYSKHIDFKKRLCIDLFALAKVYKEKALGESEKNYFDRDLQRAINGAFQIAKKARLNDLLKEISEWLYNLQNTWPFNIPNATSVLNFVTRLFTEELRLVRPFVDFDSVLSRNLEALELEAEADTWGAININDACYNLDKKLNLNFHPWLQRKAEFFEKLAAERDNSPLAAIDFIEKALRLYRELKDEKNIKRLEQRYSEIRNTGEFSIVNTKLPKEQSEEIFKNIMDGIEQSNESQILQAFIEASFYPTLDLITENAHSLKTGGLLDIIPKSIVDKYGNTIATFNTEEEKNEYNFWQSYNFYFQFGTRSLVFFFLESIKANKLSFETTLDYLLRTWYNDSIRRIYNGYEVKVFPLDLLKPGIKLLFDEVQRGINDNSYIPDFVTVTDSLVLKIEAILRYMCEKIEIPTFKLKPNKIVMEKLLDDLLADLKDRPEDKPEQITNFEEEDRKFIKFVLTEKAGGNLRNRVAHGLMDFDDYNLENVVVLFSIVLRLSKYSFHISEPV